MRPLVLVAALLACAASSALAQSLTLAPGAQVRYRLDPRGDRQSARVVQQVGDTLVVAAGRDGVPQRLALAELDRLELRDGRSHLAGMGMGAVWGFAAGAAFITVPYVLSGAPLRGEDLDLYLVAAGIFGSMGAMIGAPIGLAVGKTRWTRVLHAPARLSVKPHRDGAALTVAWRR